MTEQMIVARLRDAGHRVTSQRRLILSTIWEFDGHFTADQLHDALNSRGVSVDLSTTYRTLELLTDLDILRALHGTAPAEYERADHEVHHHLICERCGAVTQMTDDHLDDLYVHLFEQHGFVARLAHLAIPGTCDACLSNKRESE